MPAPSYDELRSQNQRLLSELAMLHVQMLAMSAEIVRLRDENARLHKALDEAQRRGKRQAAPFSKGKPKTDPKRPGRKKGDGKKRRRREPPPTDKINETFEAPLPDACPHCGGGPIEETKVEPQFQTEIPRQPIERQFNVHCGRCAACGKTVQGRHPLQTSDALGVAGVQLGADAQAAINLLNKQAGMSYGKIRDTFHSLFGITIERSTAARIVTRTGRRLDPVYQQIAAQVRDSAVVTPDETGWRVGGIQAWLHVAATEHAILYGIEPDRSGNFLERVLGAEWSGTLTHDGWSPYDNFRDAVHQQCLAHLMRRAKEILDAALGGGKRFPRQVLDLFKEALALRDRYQTRPASFATRVAAADAFGDRLLRLTKRHKAYAPNQQFAGHLRRHASDCFIFLLDPAVDATNWRGEQALRPAVVNRKVWGGNRTWRGAQAQQNITSVIATCRRQTRSALDFLALHFRGLSPILFPTQLAAGR